MFPLSPDKYNLALPSLRRVTINNLFARSVVEGHVGGRVHVDRTHAPRVFHVVHPYGMSLLFGDADEDFLRNDLLSYLLGENGRHAAPEYLQIFPGTLEKSIDALLGDHLGHYREDDMRDLTGHAVVKYVRVNFSFNALRFSDFLKGIDLGAQRFLAVDETLYNAVDGSVVPQKFWDSAADFARRGSGYSLMKTGQPVATAFSSFVHDDLFELGMETRPEWRRRGFGALVCAQLIMDCLQRGLTPVWACRSDNRGSYALALKLGFEPSARLPYYILR